MKVKTKTLDHLNFYCLIKKKQKNMLGWNDMKLSERFG